MALTKEDIFNVAERLAAEGTNPTQTAVREALGGGSFATIGPALKEWKDAQREDHALAEVVVPDALNERVEQMKAEAWKAAISEAERRLSAERDALHEAQEAADAAVVEAQEAVTTLEREAEEREREISTLKNQLIDAESVAKEALASKREAEQSFVSEQSRLKEKIDGLESRLADAKDVIDRLTALEDQQAAINKRRRSEDEEQPSLPLDNDRD
ncbi:DNA-binding protein [Vreelandella massiliensis]|uniref:DNA-binding protein n=1 Tax=Vreelandella massiliensis TaxID=1816686 RepID=UPI00096ABA7C|nr:DNA-binding protein [Halomonas massiliensis]